MTDERHGPTGEPPVRRGADGVEGAEGVVDEVDETIVTPRPRPGEARPERGIEAEDATIVAARPPRPGAVEADDATVVVARPPGQADAPVAAEAPQAPVVPPVVRGAPSVIEESGRSGHRSTANPAPPVEEPPAGELPPEVLARMFKSPLDARLRVPEAPTPPPEHTLPRRGISPGIPVLSPVRGLSEANASPGGVLSDRFGPPPASVQPPPPAQREGLRSTARANRRFGAGAIVGFAASILVAGFGLWGVAILAFG